MLTVCSSRAGRPSLPTAAATDLAKGCPLLADCGSVEVYATIDM